MTHKRLVTVYGGLLLLFAVVMGRLYLVAGNESYAGSAQAQTITTLSLPAGRGGIYDTNGVPLTGYRQRYYALSIPGESSYTRLFGHVSYAGQSVLYQRRNAAAPFLIEVDGDLTDEGIYTYASPERYLPTPIAPQLLGYLDGEGHGVAGLELAFDELLSGQGGSYVQCITTAQGTLLAGQEPRYTPAESTDRGVKLTLDERVQRICEGAAQQGMRRGCILVLDTATAAVRASVSMPEFDPTDLQRSIQADDTSFLNRPLCQFNVGSVFKPVLAAAALERGMGWFTAECKGYVQINDHVYRCAKGIAHGEMDLQSALEESCNCYFIELGLALGGGTISQTAGTLGFGQPLYLAGGLGSAAGSLPTAEALRDLGQLASVSFGQGELLATPIQIAAFYNALAQDGVYRTPGFLEGIVEEESGRMIEDLSQTESRRVLSAKTAETLRGMLIGVVEEGIGGEARPTEQGAGGKTGTAQTGQRNAAGEELMNYWFAGFYPAEEPRYTIVVLQDGLVEPEVSSAAIFAQVASALAYLDAEPGQEDAAGQQAVEAAGAGWAAAKP